MKIISIKRAGNADVFNMEVKDTHNFVIQGGVISHNCADEMRYFFMSRPIKPKLPAEKPAVPREDPLNLLNEV